MHLTIPVAHDFICPWCWVGLFQAQRLQQEFGVHIDWRGYELYPDGLEFPEPGEKKPAPENRPRTPGRFELLLWADQMELPKADRPKQMRTHNAHEAVEYAKTEGKADELVEVLYRAYWEQGLEINDPEVIEQLAKGILGDVAEMRRAIATRAYADEIIGFDDDAYARGVYNVPTFFIGGERIAEFPYAVIRRKMQELLDLGTSSPVYADLSFPEPPASRPYVLINMVATIDGKTVSGNREESVVDLGSKTDHQVMKHLEASADAVMLGAQTLRVTSRKWNPKAARRIVVTKSGDIPLESAFLSHGEAYVATPGSTTFKLPKGVKILRAGGEQLDLTILLGRLRSLGIGRLLVLGGSELNGELLRQGLVDELFLTIAPKVKLGRDLPTYAGGEPLPREELQQYSLVEHHAVGDEVFLRYRRLEG